VKSKPSSVKIFEFRIKFAIEWYRNGGEIIWSIWEKFGKKVVNR
jgi:hypothetical protein